MNTATPNSELSERPLRILIAFDEKASARSAEVFIDHVASDYSREMSLRQFGGLKSSRHAAIATQVESNTDLLVVAVRNEGDLPARVKRWMRRWLGMRSDQGEGAIVALLTDENQQPNGNCPLVSYLEAVAAVAGITFFARRVVPGGRVAPIA